MATKKKKSQAEKAANSAKTAKNKNTKKNPVSKQKEPETQIPVRLITSVAFLAAFVLFAIILFACEGALLTAIHSLVHGLIGRVGFVVSIPVLLYLFIIHAFSGKRPVALRTFCLVLRWRCTVQAL